jgi:CubicO group peptidase (beta-lactamase class C family)
LTVSRSFPVRLAFASAAAVTLLGADPGRVNAPDLKAEIDRLVQPLIKDKKVIGLVVGVVNEKGQQVHGYGKVDRDSSKAPVGETLFEIGSATKAFTGLLLADMARSGSVKVNDPVRVYLPEEAKVPERNGKEITLLDLATHTSGLPRVPPGFGLYILLTPKGMDNPYAQYTDKLLYKSLAGYELPRAIGSKYDYSNLGMGLLGHALACRAKTSYERLLVKRLFEPLQMKDTRITLSSEQHWRLARGHSKAGEPVASWDFDVLAGAGALRSTANDLLTFLAANLGLKKTKLQEAMEMSHKPQKDIDDKGFRIALGWHILPLEGTGMQAVWHNGETAGYHAFMGINKQTRTGVVVLANTAYSIDRIGFDLLKLLSKGK